MSRTAALDTRPFPWRATRWLVPRLAVLFSIGFLAVHVLGFDAPSPGAGVIPATAHYLWYGVVGVATLAMLSIVLVLPVGLGYTVFEWAKATVAWARRTYRYLADHTAAHVVGRALPFVAPTTVFVVFAWATGGIDAVFYWIVAGLMATLAAILIVGAADHVAPLMRHVGAALVAPAYLFDTDKAEAAARRVGTAATAVTAFGAFTLLFVVYARDLASVAPDRLPLTESGWGQYVAGWVGFGLVYGSGKLAFRLRRLLAPSDPGDTGGLSLTTDEDTEAPEEWWSPTVVEGWRTWTWEHGALRGYWKPWLVSHLTAECPTCDEPPGWDHRCGIYAVKERRNLSPAFFYMNGKTDIIVGRVELTGLVVEHEIGYRAEHARIVQLIVPDHLAGVVRRRYPEVTVVSESEEGRHHG